VVAGGCRTAAAPLPLLCASELFEAPGAWEELGAGGMAVAGSRRVGAHWSTCHIHIFPNYRIGSFPLPADDGEPAHGLDDNVCRVPGRVRGPRALSHALTLYICIVDASSELLVSMCTFLG
jgi:hypothetical protein